MVERVKSSRSGGIGIPPTRKHALEAHATTRLTRFASANAKEVNRMALPPRNESNVLEMFTKNGAASALMRLT
jgi:hypothetical protein